VQVRKAFDSEGQFQGGFVLPGGGTFNASLALSAGAILTGTITNRGDGSQMPVYAQNIAARPVAALAGTYTVVLPAVSGTGLPGGNGFGTLKVTPTGTVTLKGTLDDGTALTTSGVLDSNNVWRMVFTKAAAKSAGGELLLGSIALPPASGGTAGALTWFRSANRKDPIYPNGFTTPIAVMASRYTPPAVSSTSANVTFSGADLANPVMKSVSIGAKDKVIYGGTDKFSLTFTAVNGLFTGSFLDNGIARSFTGAVIQSGSSGMGLFQEKSGQTGSVLFQSPQ